MRRSNLNPLRAALAALSLGLAPSAARADHYAPVGIVTQGDALTVNGLPTHYAASIEEGSLDTQGVSSLTLSTTYTGQTGTETGDVLLSACCTPLAYAVPGAGHSPSDIQYLSALVTHVSPIHTTSGALYWTQQWNGQTSIRRTDGLTITPNEAWDGFGPVTSQFISAHSISTGLWGLYSPFDTLHRVVFSVPANTFIDGVGESNSGPSNTLAAHYNFDGSHTCCGLVVYAGAALRTVVPQGALHDLTGAAINAGAQVAYAANEDGTRIYRAETNGSSSVLAMAGGDVLSIAPLQWPGIDDAGRVYYLASTAAGAALFRTDGITREGVAQPGDSLRDGHTIAGVSRLLGVNGAGTALAQVTREDGNWSVYRFEQRSDLPTVSVDALPIQALGGTTSLVAHASDDRTAAADLAVQWKLLDPSGADRTALLSAPTATSTSFVPTLNGHWSASIAVTNQQGFSASASVDISVGMFAGTYSLPLSGAFLDTCYNGSGPPWVQYSQRLPYGGGLYLGCASGLPTAMSFVFSTANLTGVTAAQVGSATATFSATFGGTVRLLPAELVDGAIVTPLFDPQYGASTNGSSFDVTAAVKSWVAGGSGSTPGVLVLVPDALLPAIINGVQLSFVIPPTCGNGVLEAPEACDDGNTDPFDGCSPACTFEPGWSCATSSTGVSTCTRAQTDALSITTGDAQAALPGAPFSDALAVALTDTGGQPVQAQPITFTVLSQAGASGTFADGSTTAIVRTDASGLATAPALTAAGLPASFSVVATTPSAIAGATFTLTVHAAAIAVCHDVTVSASDQACTADGQIDFGSVGPAGVAISQAPAGPFALGPTSVTLTVAGAYNTATCSGVVTVIDASAPVIALLGAAQITLAQGAAFVDPGATAHDNCAGDLTAAITVAGAVQTSTPGAYTLTYSVSDPAGNAAAVSREVIVPGAPDAGADGGSANDAGSTADAGADAGSLADAGTGADAGHDAGTIEDAGSSDGVSGGGCASAGLTPSLLALVGLVFLRRRKGARPPALNS